MRWHRAAADNLGIQSLTVEDDQQKSGLQTKRWGNRAPSVKNVASETGPAATGAIEIDDELGLVTECGDGTSDSSGSGHDDDCEGHSMSKAIAACADAVAASPNEDQYALDLVSGPGSSTQRSPDSQVRVRGRNDHRADRAKGSMRERRSGFKAANHVVQQAQYLIQEAVEYPSASSKLPNPRNLRRSRRRAGEKGSDLPPGPAGCVVLIREDCRLHDNPALTAALNHPWVVPLYVHDDADPSPCPVRGAGLWWRHESLKAFDKSLGRLGSRIVYRRGLYIEQILDVMMETGAAALYFNRQLEPWHHQRDLELQFAAEDLGLKVGTFKGMVMAFEPWETRDRSKPKEPLEEPLPTITGSLCHPPSGWPPTLHLEDLGYGRTGGRKIPPGRRQFNEKRQFQLLEGFGNRADDDWAFEMRLFWKMGEEAAMERLEEFVKEAAWGCYFPPDLHPRDQAGGRFRADKKWTGILSPYIRFGDLSPRYVYARCKQVLPFEHRRLFIKRILWRDKAYAQLFNWPESHAVSIKTMYEHQSWSGTRKQLRSWQRGETGFPLVDAAMRQLWKVGWMCNHLRHVTAQFLIEHLDLSWKDGFDWYDYTLVDTDVAINAMMWQMGGHSGLDSWNFVMHPVFAGKKVDPEGNYVRRWLPELRHLPVEYIHCPWEAPAGTRISANVLINGVYWRRILEDLIAARKVHQKNVIKVRLDFPHLVDKDGSDLLFLDSGRVLKLDVRDDIRENAEDKITLLMTADDPRSHQRRNLALSKGVHCGLIYDETKRFESMYGKIGDAM